MAQIQTKFKQTEIGLIPEDWELVELGVISEIKSGKSRPKESGIFPVYGGNGILDYANDFNIENESIIIGRVGAYCGCIYKENKKFWLSDNALGLINNEKSNLLFLYYLLKKMDLNKQSIGGAQPLLTQGILKQLKLPLPPLPEQKAIAEILSSLDDKIELLEKQNKTLENIGQALFKSWFVDFEPFKNDLVESEMGMIPRGWKIGKLGEELDITIGRTPPRLESQWFSKNKEDFKWISIKDIGNSGPYIFETSEFLTKEAVEKFRIPIIPENTAILSFKMTVGKLTITTEKMLSNEAIAHLKTKENGNLSAEFIYLALQSLNFNSLGSTSSIVTSVNTAIIKEIDIIIPSEDLLVKFNRFIKPLFEKIKENNLQIQTLSNLRDSLLPRLMSGKIRVV